MKYVCVAYATGADGDGIAGFVGIGITSCGSDYSDRVAGLALDVNGVEVTACAGEENFDEIIFKEREQCLGLGVTETGVLWTFSGEVRC